MKSKIGNRQSAIGNASDPEVAMQEVPDWTVHLTLLAFAAWCGVLRYGPSVVLAVFYAAITSTTAIVIIHHLSR